MAGSGQPWFMPLLWPVGHVFTMYKNDQKPFVNKATAELDLFGHFTSFAGALRAWMMALGLIYYLYDDYDYPGFGRGKTFSLDWILPILFRNIVCTWLICGFWDYILYFSPFSSKLDQFKFTKIYPSMKQFKHDSFWTTTASVFAGLIEVVLCYLWSNNYIKCDRNIMDAPIKNIILGITVTHWRIPHFWLIHRMMHPWKTTNIPDFGKILYKHVHSLHHKSYNPTSFSGTSMHPIESTLYYSAALLCLPFAPHPSIALTVTLYIYTQNHHKHRLPYIN